MTPADARAAERAIRGCGALFDYLTDARIPDDQDLTAGQRYSICFLPYLHDGPCVPSAHRFVGMVEVTDHVG